MRFKIIRHGQRLGCKSDSCAHGTCQSSELLYVDMKVNTQAAASIDLRSVHGCSDNNTSAQLRFHPNQILKSVEIIPLRTQMNITKILVSVLVPVHRFEFK